MSVLRSKAYTAGIDLNGATEEQKVVLFKATVSALEDLLDRDNNRQTDRSIQLIKDDITEMVAQIKQMRGSLFGSQQAILAHLREARNYLSAAYELVDSERKSISFFKRLEQARKSLEDGYNYFL